MHNTSEALDSDELLHLAINASQHAEVEKAIGYLKRAQDQTPEDGRVLYLLASLHAELGMYERAIEEMEQATKLAPEIETAHFQLGLLYISLSKVDEAVQAWSKLKTLDENHYLRLFSDGIEVLVLEDDFKSCIDKLKQGIQNNHENPALNNDMNKMIHAAEYAINENDALSSNVARINNLSDADKSTSPTGKQAISIYNNKFDS